MATSDNTRRSTNAGPISTLRRVAWLEAEVSGRHGVIRGVLDKIQGF
jgi:hypothetical protein